jgi:hypothetical protein
MKKRKTKCLALMPTGCAPWSPWRTACGKVQDEDTLTLDWPLEAFKRPEGLCRVCWSKMRPVAAAFHGWRISVAGTGLEDDYTPMYDGDTLPTITHPSIMRT